MATDIVKTVLKAQSGDSSAFEELYKQTHNLVYYIARQIVGNDEDAYDIVQTTYIKAFNSLDTLSDPASFSAWVGRIASNSAKYELRKKKQILFSDIRIGDDDDDTSGFNVEDSDETVRPDIAMDKEEAGRLVRNIVDKLPAEQRLVTMMYYFQDISVKDIAEEIGCSENTIKSRLRYARMSIERGVKELEDRGTILRGFAPIPFFIEGIHAGADIFGLSAPAAAQVLAGISGKVGGSTAAGGGATAGVSTAAGAVAASTGTVISIKAIAVIAAIAIAAGGGGYYAWNQASADANNNEQIESETTEDAESESIDLESEQNEKDAFDESYSGMEENRNAFGFDSDALFLNLTYKEVEENYPDFKYYQYEHMLQKHMLFSHQREIRLLFYYIDVHSSENGLTVFVPDENRIPLWCNAPAKIVFPEMGDVIMFDDIEQLFGVTPNIVYEDMEVGSYIDLTGVERYSVEYNFSYKGYRFSYMHDALATESIEKDIFPETIITVYNDSY